MENLFFWTALFITLTLTPQFASAQVEPAKYLFVLDIDRVLIDEEPAKAEASNQSQLITVEGRQYRVAPFVTEFLAALQFSFPAELGASIEIAVFSAGPHIRNQGVVNALRLNEYLPLKDFVSNIKSFNDLSALRPDLAAMTKSEQLRAAGVLASGPNKIPFFDLMAKDLSIFGRSLDHVIIFDDNLNAVPYAQRKNIVAVARPDIIENEVKLEMKGTTHWSPPGEPETQQAWRTKNRLVRAVGIMSFAIQRFRAGKFKTLPLAIEALQWESVGTEHRFRTEYVNKAEVYREGARILRRSLQAPTLKPRTCAQMFAPK